MQGVPDLALTITFQSLFSWISVIGAMMRAHGRPLWVSILVFMDLGHRPLELTLEPLAIEFQSLFSWISVIGIGLSRPPKLPDLWFQSLFSWISVIGMLTASASADMIGFQSLFSWISVIGLQWIGRRRRAQ